MFAEATRIIETQVMPIIGASKGYASNNRAPKVSTLIGASILLNEDGWVLTCEHVFSGAMSMIEQSEKARQWEAIASDQTLSATEKKRSRQRLGGKPKIEEAAVVWGQTNTSVGTCHFNKTLDLAVLQVNGLQLPSDFQYPRFRTDEVRPGDFLCRVGYPLMERTLRIDWDGSGFVANTFPTLFANSGLVSRYAETNGVRFIELDSPGLNGQSGGPVIDEEGRICGLQSRTAHYEVAFGGKRHVWYDVGQAISVTVIFDFLDSHGIDYLR